MMEMNITGKQCNSENYRKGRGEPIKYIVVHYTGNNGDTAKNNVDYFANNVVKASAHFFIDDNEVLTSVDISDTAYHCGAKTYKHKYCRNSNSIGVEMCSRKDASGNYYITERTEANAISLVQELMQKYQIPLCNVLRHFDVTGKKCPEPYVRNSSLWEGFKKRLEVTAVTVEEAMKIVKEKAALSESTIQYLYNYRYGDDLLKKLVEAMLK